MKVTVDLAPPFKKPGSRSSFSLELPRDDMNLRQLAEHVNELGLDEMKAKVIDRQGFLTASFMVNGEHALPDQSVLNGDKVIIYRRIGGG